MAMLDAKIVEVAAKDARFAYEAYDFIFKALDHSHAALGRRSQPVVTDKAAADSLACHVSSHQLLESIRDLALQEFGLMARTVFRMWGVHSTEDFGQIVFNLVDAGLINKSADDTLADFKDVFDFEEALVQGYTIQLDEAR